MQVSEFLTLEEATYSSFASQHGLKNNPSSDVIDNMQHVALNIYDKIAVALGKVKINSFYRSSDLNRAIGGAAVSGHMLGQAMDLDMGRNNKKLFDYIYKNLSYDQLIWEAGNDKNPDWVHVSLKLSGNRNQALRGIKNESGKMMYVPYDQSKENTSKTDPVTSSTLAKLGKPKNSSLSKMNTITPPKNSKMPTNSSKGGVNRIRTIFEHEIELDELSLPKEANKPGTKSPPVENVVAVEWPLIKINDYIFSRTEIVSVEIESTDFLPKISFNARIASQLFIAKEMPKDGDILSIAIKNKSDALRIIRNDYVITGVHVLQNTTSIQNPATEITFYGELFVPGLKSQVGDKAYLGTSFEAMQGLAKDLKLGFATNEYNTDDKQIWLKANIGADLFIKQVTERSWKDSESFYNSWIDVYYNLNFININMQLISSESEVDVATTVSNIDKNTFFSKESDTNLMPKVFSNLQQFIGSAFYIRTWRPMNASTRITFQIGTKMTCEMFEHNKNLYEDDNKQKYWAIGIEPNYDKDKVGKSILFRGRSTQQNDSNNPALKRANHSFIGLYEKFPWLGIQYTISNPDEDNFNWDGNHHKNYQVSKVQNLINNKELEKMNLWITVAGNNFNIIRGDKLPIALIRINTMDNTLIREETTYNDTLDLFYSGWYIVKGFNLSWSHNDDNIMSGFEHEYILTRREWPTPIPIDSIKQ